jgi:hypothetical protein
VADRANCLEDYGVGSGSVDVVWTAPPICLQEPETHVGCSHNPLFDPMLSTAIHRNARLHSMPLEQMTVRELDAYLEDCERAIEAWLRSGEESELVKWSTRAVRAREAIAHATSTAESIARCRDP